MTRDYDVTITETLEKTIKVSAESRQDAERMAREQYGNSEIVLDAENFVGVDFSTDEGREKLLDALLVCPGEYPKKVQIGSTLEDLQEQVGGSFECFCYNDDSTCILACDTAKIYGMPQNRALHDDDGRVKDIINGNFLVIGLGNDDFASLNAEQMAKYEEMFHVPEAFVWTGKRWMSIPMEKEDVAKLARSKAERSESPTHDGKAARDFSSTKSAVRKSHDCER
ncbi:MAG: DUF3846 domain-containing protein [Clostridia bacterium]|nr:DUF3846 domain-containing protein [Clostridia bacterium]